MAQVVAESSLCQTRVCESSSVSSNTLLSRRKFPLGATPRSVNGTGSSRGFQHQANAPHLGRGANPKIYIYIYIYLYSPRTQAYGETNYLREKVQVLDTTRYNHTSFLGSEARCYQKHSQSSTLLGNLLRWFILGFSFSGDYLMRITVHSAVILVSLISLICCWLV